MAEILKAEMWDRMQFLFRNFYDRMVHAKFIYEGAIDIKALKNVIVFMIEKAPVLHSSFHNHHVEPYWQVENYTVDDILSIVNTNTPDEDADKFLTDVIPFDNNVQMKICIFTNDNKSIFTLCVNHMCMDGGDLKYFLTTLIENYNNITSGNSNLKMKSGTRSYSEVYGKFEGEDLKKAKNLYRNVATCEDKQQFPWSPSSEQDVNRIIKRKIDEDRFNKIKKICKNFGVTVNDAFMTFVVRSLYELGDFNENEPLTVSGAIDLRKHIVDGASDTGVTNHTAWMAIRLMSKGKTPNDTLIELVKVTKKYKRDKFMGLHSLPLLKLAYDLFPPAIAESAIKAGYSNPLFAVSNIGLLDEKKLTFKDTKLVDGFLSGAVKYKPFFLMSLTTLKNQVTLSTAIRGNEEDEKVANKFFDLMEKNIWEFIEQNKERINN